MSKARIYWLGFTHFMMELPPDCYGKRYEPRSKTCKLCSFKEECSKIENLLDRVC